MKGTVLLGNYIPAVRKWGDFSGNVALGSEVRNLRVGKEIKQEVEVPTKLISYRVSEEPLREEKSYYRFL
jgi:hypothetical protein